MEVADVKSTDNLEKSAQHPHPEAESTPDDPQTVITLPSIHKNLFFFKKNLKLVNENVMSIKFMQIVWRMGGCKTLEPVD